MLMHNPMPQVQLQGFTDVQNPIAVESTFLASTVQSLLKPFTVEATEEKHFGRLHANGHFMLDARYDYATR